MTKKDRITNEHIKGTLKVYRFWTEDLTVEAVKRRDDDYVGRKVLEIQLPGKRKWKANEAGVLSE